jgi:hypothetical protein
MFWRPETKKSTTEATLEEQLEISSAEGCSTVEGSTAEVNTPAKGDTTGKEHGGTSREPTKIKLDNGAGFNSSRVSNEKKLP